jgi:hypothetical protein
MVKAALNFEGGAVVLDIPFLRTNESIIREAMEHLRPLAAEPCRRTGRAPLTLVFLTAASRSNPMEGFSASSRPPLSSAISSF